MRVFLAGVSSRTSYDVINEIPFVLESFYGLKGNKTLEFIARHDKENFLLDSGAFTFMSNTGKGNIDWKDYIDRYIDFINKYNIKYFFELDIDVIVGYENVKKIRKYIEAKTQKKCIPVWHKARGKEEFIKLCEEYDYVAIGGIVTKEITSKEYKYFTWFINEAHKRGTKIHGLGFTNLKDLKKYPFDSVDSTSWASGSRFGAMYVFDGQEMTSRTFDNKRVKNGKKLNIHNTKEWIKFQRYAEKHL